ncbi:MAG: metallophosphatase family protein [Rikenellaceae bacterium]|jgi:putative phosphoesterase|nr:metallophosphatase family protein [Rikenellaceae bacterium]
MKTIGIISDTHGVFDDTLRTFLNEVDEIWHAGDIGSIEIADQIAAFRPLRAVHGNIDGGTTRVAWPRWATFMCEDVKVLMTHIGGYPGHYAEGVMSQILQTRPQIFVTGHSHILRVGYDKKYNLLHVNPGAAGISGFHNVRTAIRLVIDGRDIKDMEVGEWPR